MSKHTPGPWRVGADTYLGEQHQMVESEQEPVAWIHGDEFGDACHWVGGSMPPAGTKLYTAPPQRKPLTEGELEQAYRSIWSNIPRNFNHTSMGWIEQGIRYAEQAHGIGEKHE